MNVANVPDRGLHDLVKAIEKNGVHDHLCLIYETQEEQFSAVIPFMKTGLERGEKCIYIVDDNTAAMVIDGMKGAGIDVESAVESGKLTIASKQDAYLKQGYFDSDWMIGFLKCATDEAKAAGFSALRVTGEMTWMLGGDPGTERLMEYEAKLNYFFPENDALAICQYNRNRFSPKIIKDVISTHPLVICGGMVCRNFYYVPPDDFLGEEQPVKEIDRLLANIMSRNTVEKELLWHQESLQELVKELRERTTELERRNHELGLMNKAFVGRELRMAELKERIRKTGAYNRSLIEASLDPLVTIGPDGRITDVNAATESVTGFTREELIGTDFSDYFTEPEKARRGYQQAFQEGLVRDYPLEIRHRDGQVTSVLYNASVYRDEDGQVLGVFAAARDITQLRSAEEELHKLNEGLEKKVQERTAELKWINERFSLAVNAASLGVWDWDLQKKELLWDDRMYALYGIKKENFADTYEAWLQGVHPEDRACIDKIVKLSQRGEREYDTEFRVVWPDGTVHHLKAYGQFVRDADGTPVRMTGINFDITERKRAEEALRDSEQRLAVLIDFLPDATLAIDKDKRIIIWNRAIEEMTGIPAEEMIGKGDYAYTIPFYGVARPQLMDLFWYPEHEIAAQYPTLKKESQNLVIEVYCPALYGGTGAFVWAKASPLRDSEGHLTGAIECIRDITDRKRAEEELKRLNDELEQRVYERTVLLQRKTGELERANESLKEIDRLKSTFIASMSHELRTPLNAVIGFSAVLLDEWLGPVNAEQKENLESILGSGKHLLNMINDVLDVTQIEAGTNTPATEEFDLYDLLTEAESEVTATIRDKGLELRSELVHQRMRTDRRRLLQCVRNILSNAAKYSDKGSVAVAARIVSSSGETPEEAMVEIAVTDTGIGIGEEDLSGIFQPFFRIVTPERAVVPGTGLGLFLTRKIATEILKGDLLVSSEQGKGSRFSLRIPVRLS